VVPRAQMLAELMRLKQGIAIAGTHGKTTTTSLVASDSAEAAWTRPSSSAAASTAPAPTRAWAGATFWWPRPTNPTPPSCFLSPVMAVVTNIDADHMETYGHDFGG
jgi:UDP-N-acetylmuramate--alanine ligase